MKALILLAVLAQTNAPATAPRTDVHFVLGWQNLHKEQPQNTYDDWLNGILYAGGGAGWYWTEHLKTQIDFGAGTDARQYRFRQFTAGNAQAFESSRVTTSQRNITVGQQYQFFHNQWFHPHVGGGVDVAQQTTTTDFDPVFVSDPVTRVSRQLSAARTEGPRVAWSARPFLEAGFKGYMTRRAFFTADSRVMVRSGIDEVLFRFGFGVDF